MHQGFVLSPLIAKLLEEYEEHPEKWPSFREFAPQLLSKLNERLRTGLDWSQLYLDIDGDYLSEPSLSRTVMRACGNYDITSAMEGLPQDRHSDLLSFLSILAVNWAGMNTGRDHVIVGIGESQNVVKLYSVSTGDDMPAGVYAPVRYESGRWLARSPKERFAGEIPEKWILKDPEIRGGFVAVGRFPRNPPGKRDCLLIHAPRIVASAEGAMDLSAVWGNLARKLLTRCPLILEEVPGAASETRVAAPNWLPVKARLEKFIQK